MQWPTSQTRMKGGQPCEVGSARAYSSACRLALSISTSQARLAPRRPRWPDSVFGGEKVALAGDSFVALPAALLGFQDERVALVEVDAPDRLAFVAVATDGAFEDVIVEFVGGVGDVGVRGGRARRKAR